MVPLCLCRSLLTGLLQRKCDHLQPSDATERMLHRILFESSERFVENEARLSLCRTETPSPQASRRSDTVSLLSSGVVAFSGPAVLLPHLDRRGMGDGVAIMTAAFSLNDVTLGYDRHPAVHHLTGNSAGSLTVKWVRQEYSAQGSDWFVVPTRWSFGTQWAAPRYAYQQAEIDRGFPHLCYGDRLRSLADDRFRPVNEPLWFRPAPIDSLSARPAGAVRSYVVAGLSRHPA